jgi:hypothetical protein
MIVNERVLGWRMNWDWLKVNHMTKSCTCKSSSNEMIPSIYAYLSVVGNFERASDRGGDQDDASCRDSFQIKPSHSRLRIYKYPTKPVEQCRLVSCGSVTEYKRRMKSWCEWNRLMRRRSWLNSKWLEHSCKLTFYFLVLHSRVLLSTNRGIKKVCVRDHQ